MVGHVELTNDALAPTVPPASADSSALPERILDVVLRHRRLVPEHQYLAAAPTPGCRSPHLAKVRRAVEEARPIHFILPAFPAKSGNRTKTLGPLPDLGERIGLEFLQSVCADIGAIYPHGGRITICSDGRVFSDLVLLSDDDVTAYKRALLELLVEARATSVDHFDLDDVFPGEEYPVMREELLVRHGISLHTLRGRVRDGDADMRTMFNGIHRFMVEDYAALFPNLSRNQLRTATKTVAYRVIQRSLAWSSLVEQKFPHSLRLSIHPQRADSRKIGIMLVPSTDAWGTPWHNVVVVQPEGPCLMKRRDAEQCGAVLVCRDGRPSHYVLPAPTDRQG